MKHVVIVFAFFCFACNSLEIHNSRGELKRYQEDGFAIKVNDSLVQYDKLILDEDNIKSISINSAEKLIIITRKEGKSDLNLIPLNWMVESDEKEKLLVVDGEPIATEQLDSMYIEMSTIKSAQVLKDASNFGHRTYKEVVVITTTNVDGSPTSRTNP